MWTEIFLSTIRKMKNKITLILDWEQQRSAVAYQDPQADEGEGLLEANTTLDIMENSQTETSDEKKRKNLLQKH